MRHEHLQELHLRLGIPADYQRRYGLPEYSEAQALIDCGTDIADRPYRLSSAAARHWQAMSREAQQAGIVLQVVSAYRSIARQAEIIQHKLDDGQTIEAILNVCAAPGYSEHHTGNALDLTTPGFKALDQRFENSDAFAWLQQNAGRFAFQLSYPRHNKHGIAYEPWHWAYKPDTI